MEDYYILLLNTSTLGYILTPTKGNDSSLTLYNLFKGSLNKIYANATTAIKLAVSLSLTELLDIENETADKIAKKLGI